MALAKIFTEERIGTYLANTVEESFNKWVDRNKSNIDIKDVRYVNSNDDSSSNKIIVIYETT